MEYDIEYLGIKKHFNQGFEMLTDEEYEDIKSKWYTKPTRKELEYEWAGLRHGGTVFGKTTKYYFRDLMDNTRYYKSPYTINEVLNYKPLLSQIVHRTKWNKKVFHEDNIIANIDKAFGLGASDIAKKATQFPLATIDYVLREYNCNGKWYDYSCGWGARLCGALKNNVEYYGTDPNYLLTERLYNFANDYREACKINTKVEIFTSGSEKTIEKLIGKMGLAFSSPPYFSLEDYQTGEQSYKKGVSYDEWCNSYWKPTMQNINKYLINGGYFICNIKDFDKYNLERDTVQLANDCGFYLYKTDSLTQGKRLTTKENPEDILISVDENIYVFVRKGEEPKMVHDEQMDIFDFI